MVVAIFCLQQSAWFQRESVKMNVRGVASTTRALRVRFKLLRLALHSFYYTPFLASGTGIGSN